MSRRQLHLGSIDERTTASEALASLTSGQTVFVQGACATPTILLEALAARAATLEGVRVVHLHTEGPAPHLAPSLAGHLRHLALFVGANAREAIAEGRAEYVPVLLGDVPSLFLRGVMPVDLALIHVSPFDRAGYCSLGTSVDVTLGAVRAARRVVAQVNPRMPRTHGDGFIHRSEIDALVHVDAPLHEVAPPVIGDVEARIGARVAELVPDGATLQMGIGSIPAAVCAALRGKRDLGVHTEMLTDAVVDLVESGALTGDRKEINRGKIVTSFVMGTRRLYDFVDDSGMIEMRPVDYTNEVAIIRRFRRMVSINSALEIDLGGQVCADSVGHRIYSGAGGQLDFIRGATLAEEGRAIIALPSTAAGGRVSRIVVDLRPGAGVVTTRAHVRTVVTEWGTAELFGLGLRERARALIAIAHPAHRERLAIEARAAGL
jgi:4-hydroxybutyrate CoA-transferase